MDMFTSCVLLSGIITGLTVKRAGDVGSMTVTQGSLAAALVLGVSLATLYRKLSGEDKD